MQIFVKINTGRTSTNFVEASDIIVETSDIIDYMQARTGPQKMRIRLLEPSWLQIGGSGAILAPR
eukprot:7571632-Karenia_brevis.AAC.1